MGIDLTTPMLGPVDSDACTLAQPFHGGRYDDATVDEFAASLLHWTGTFGLRTSLIAGQIAKETGFFRYGGQVQPGQFNFAGLGATNDGAGGASYKSVDQGVIAVCAHHMVYIFGRVANWPAAVQQWQPLDQRYSAVLSTGNAGKIIRLEDYTNGRWAFTPSVPIGSLDNGYARGIAQLAQQFSKELPVSDVPYDRIHQAADDGPSRSLDSIQWFIVHDTEGSFPGDEAVLTSAAPPIESAHFLIGRVPTQCVYSVPLDRTAWTPGNDAVAMASVNVELSRNPALGETHYTAYQIAKLAEVFNWCVAQGVVNVPAVYIGRVDADGGPLPDAPGIIGHQDVPDDSGGWGGSSHHTDPGPTFPWDDFLAAIKGAPPVNDPSLHLNGYVIGGGFRAFYESAKFPAQQFGLPLSDEHQAIIIDNDFTRRQRTVQFFERATFIYQPENPPEWQVVCARADQRAEAVTG